MRRLRIRIELWELRSLMYNPPKSRKALVLFGSVICVVPLLLFGGMIRDYWLASAFPRKQLRQYEKLYKGPASGRVGSGRLPYRTGKVIVVKPSVQMIQLRVGSFAYHWTEIQPSQRKRIQKEDSPPRIHESWYELDASIRASSPDEVATVILCEPQMISDGIYVSKDPDEYAPAYKAYKRNFRLLVYDLKGKVFVGEYVVKGDSAPDETTIIGSHAGEKPDVAAAIAQMPLRE